MNKKNYQESLPKKRVSSGALFFNDKKEILIVKTTYKNHWSLPGGTVDENESPSEACKREIKEELGLDMKPGKLLVVSYEHQKNDNLEVLMFLFDGGILNQEEIENIILQESEIQEFQFITLEKSKALLSESTDKRVRRAISIRPGKEESVYLDY